jgi:hypothetical protein
VPGLFRIEAIAPRPSFAIMSTTTRFLGLLLAVVAAEGCATTATKSVPVRPLAEGQTTAAAEYDLRVGGGPGGRVVLLAGHAIKEAAHRQVVHVGLMVDNHSASREYRLPTNQILLSSATVHGVPLLEVNEAPAPGLLEVPAGESRTFDLKFLVPEQQAINDRQLFDLHWQLDVDGGQEPVVRSTAFATTPRKAVAQRELLKDQVTAMQPLTQKDPPPTIHQQPNQRPVMQRLRAENPIMMR